MKRCSFIFTFIILCIQSCRQSDIKPVDLYPEDMCSECRMAISNAAFASEIITNQNEVYKFDDIGCMMDHKKNLESKNIAAMFVKDFESKHWIPYETSTIVETGIKTPMGSGKIAFKDSWRAAEYVKKYPKEMSK